MEAVVIQTNSKSTQKLLLGLAKKLGEKASVLDEETMEDLALGKMMKQAKTGKLVSKETVLSILNK